MLDMTRAREVFEASQDFTVGLEEEFQILDPDTHSLVHRFGELERKAQDDDVLAVAVADELVQAGVTIIFNYSEALLQVPPDVTVHTSSPAADLLYALYFYLT